MARKAHETRCELAEFGQINRTWHEGIGFQKQGSCNWRFIDMGTGNAVGPQHLTKWALLADLDRYVDSVGF